MREYTVVFRDVADIARFVSMATRHPSRVELVHEESTYNAKSLLSLFCLQLRTPMKLLVYDNSLQESDLLPFLQELQPA